MEKLFYCLIHDSKVDEKMIKAFGEQLFRSGFIHGDPHPANGKWFYHTW